MPKLTLSRLKTLSRKTQVLVAIALLLGLGVSMLLVQGDGQPHSAYGTKQVAQTPKAGTVLGDSTDATSAETSVSDSSESPVTSGPTRQQTPTKQTTVTGVTQNPAPSPVPTPTPAPDPCDKVVVGPAVTYAETNISFVESVTIPVGCSAGPFTVKTTDNRTVTFTDFTNKPTSPVKGVMGFAGTSTGTSASYTVVITDAAIPDYYEDFAFIEDPSLSYGGFAVTVKITVIPR